MSGSEYFITVYFLNNTTGFVGGHNTLLKTTDGGGPIGIRPISNQVPTTFNLYQNYPNPFNPKTKIRFQAPLSPPEGGKQIISLKIYDILGREVTTLFSSPWGRIGGATYEVEFDGSNFASGVYFYQLIVDDNTNNLDVYTETKKMILIK